MTAAGVFRPCSVGSVALHDVRVMAQAIVVGMDESAASLDALRWAAEESRLTGLPLCLLHVWQKDDLPAASTGATDYARACAADARARVTRWARDALGDDAGKTRWTLEIVEGAAGPALVSRSRTAQVLVLGTAEHTGQRHVIGGSVSRYCLAHAVPPVVNVPAVALAEASCTSDGSDGNRR
jgi:nucleotide-binding universal stress UspA family protein